MNMVLEILGQQVMLDSDLAMLKKNSDVKVIVYTRKKTKLSKTDVLLPLSY